jgi:hypothetical protein
MHSSGNVLDHRTVILNLTASNLQHRPIFLTEYSARSAYALDDLSPQAWQTFLQQLEYNIDGDMMGLVYEFFMKSSATARTCDRTCRLKLINCHFRTARAEDRTFCT